MIRSFRPLHNCVLLRRLAPDLLSDGGLHIDQEYAEVQQRAVVVAVGPGAPRRKRIHVDTPRGPVSYIRVVGEPRPCTVKPGDIVRIPKRGGTKITVDGVEHVVYREDAISGVFEVEP